MTSLCLPTKYTASVLTALALSAALTRPSLAVPVPTPGYTVTLFASGVAGVYVAPDSLTTDGSFVYAGYQNSAAADGSSGNSVVVQYTLGGAAVRQFPVNGKCDGLRIDPSTGLLWALSNEDANPRLTIIDPRTGQEQLSYAPLPTETRFAGGYDDLAFTPAGTFISASNPALNRDGVNTYRAIGLIRLVGDSAVVTPVLQGDAMATDRTTGAQVELNLTDPDSLSVDPNTGDVVLDDQGDSQLIFVRNAASDAREVSRLLLQPASPAAPVVDETTWTTSASGRFLVADHGNPGAIWVIHKTAGFAPGQAYVTVGNDSPTFTSSLGTLDTTSGLITPVVTHFSSPKGLIFVE